MAEEPQHWPTERMINEGHAEYATHEDFEGVSDNVLVEIAGLCEVTQAAPDECIPCWAYAEYLERQKPPEETEEDSEEPETPKLDALMSEEIPFIEAEVSPTLTQNATDVPVAERFASHVRVLNLLVEELLDGPPIPPPNVSEDDLALLVVAAQRWIRLMEAQGLDLGGPQQAILDATRALVSRLHRG